MFTKLKKYVKMLYAIILKRKIVNHLFLDENNFFGGLFMSAEVTREKIMRTDKTKVNMQFVDKLYALRRERNEQLKGTDQFCNLFPNIHRTVCKECSGNELCLKYKAEREYIHSQEETKGNSRRRRKQDNPKKNESGVSEECFDSDDVYEDEAKEYPCKEMFFACPDKDKCEYGKKCSYNPESD